jgi:hypothetical protein
MKMTARNVKRLALGCGILAILLLAFGIYYRVKIDPLPPSKDTFDAVVTEIFVFDEDPQYGQAFLYVTYEEGTEEKEVRIYIQNTTKFRTKSGKKIQITDLEVGQHVRVTTGTEMYYEPPTIIQCYKVVAYPMASAAESSK